MLLILMVLVALVVAFGVWRKFGAVQWIWLLFGAAITLVILFALALVFVIGPEMRRTIRQLPPRSDAAGAAANRVAAVATAGHTMSA